LSPLLGRFLIHDLDRLLLATRVGGAALSAGHGFPGRRHALDVRRHSLACTCRAWAQK
jgi:hypothetical protein